MKQRKQEKQSASPLSRILIGILLVVGSGMILVESLPILREYLPERTQREQEKLHHVQETVDNSVLPLETVDMPQESQATEEIPQETQVEPSMEPTTEASVPTDPVTYESNRWDRSYDDGNGYTLDYYYDYIQLENNGPACQKINEQLYREAETFMGELSQKQIETPILSVYGTVEDGILTMETEVTHNGQGFFSMQLTRNYYMGGNHSTKTVSSATYSLTTGEKVGLAEILPSMEEEILTQMLADLIFQNVTGYVYGDSAMLDSIYQMLSNYTLESFVFLLQDGEVQLLFWPSQFVGGPHGQKWIPTGLYIE